jgi:hypothetical protein
MKAKDLSRVHLEEEDLQQLLRKWFYESEEKRILLLYRRNQMASRLIVAKFRSKCALCDEWIDAGTEVYWDRNVTDPKKRITHVECPIIKELRDKPVEDPYPPEPKKQDNEPLF